MELLNATKMQAGYTMGLRPDGRELLVIVVKGTFTIPASGREPQPADKQVPLVMADVFTGEPGFSAPLYESDYPPHKPRCDVLLNGSAYAPGGKPVERVAVSLRVDSLRKSFDVVGNRVWRHGILGASATRPEPFTVMPISYNNAFGGVDKSHQDPARHRTYLANHVGIGYHDRPTHPSIDDKPLPNTEESGKPVSDPRGKYRPMAFGPIFRAWQPRIKYVGTYDQNWIDNVFPFLPADFDERYYQAAPEDQQTDHLQGGEEVELINLTPEGRTQFCLPKASVPVEFFRIGGESETVDAVLDTLLLEPDKKHFILAWRASIPLRKNMFEIPEGIVGRMPPSWYRARETGKTWYPSLRELVADRLSEAEEAAEEPAESEETDREESGEAEREE
jgi:hypothetical protein